MKDKEHIIGEEPPEPDSIETDSIETDSIGPDPIEQGGLSLLFAVGCLLLLGLGIPILLIFYLKSPPLDQLMPVMGISFSKIVYVFLISAAIVNYASVLFLKARSVMILPAFVISLYGCFPFVVGLRNNLPLTEALIDTPLLTHLPFYLKPAYLFFEFLVPAGILVCLFLQIKNIFSKRTHSFAFLALACYLGTAAALGFSILTQAGLPNLMSIATAAKDPLTPNRNLPQTYPVLAPSPVSPPVVEVASPPHAVQVPDGEAEPEPVRPSETTGLRPPMAVPKDVSTMNEIDRKIQELSTKLDHVIDMMNPKPLPVEQGGQDQTPVSVKSPKRDEPTADAPVAVKPAVKRGEAETLEQKLQQVSVRLTDIAEAISRIESQLPNPSAPQPKSMDMSRTPTLSAPQTSVTPEAEPTAETKDGQGVAQELSRISTKIDQIWETLSHDKKPQKLPKKIQ